jgi:arylsulfatase A-like enzyme
MPRPSILWIVTTQWRGQALGCMGDPNARTPYLDALAAQSINFTQAVTPHPFGPFARAALLTGVASPANGVRDYYDSLPIGARTIAHAMRERGYATAFFGKWGVGRRDPRVPLVGAAAAQVPVPPEERGGFEFWEGFEGGFQVNNPWLHGSQEELAVPKLFPGYQSDVVSERWAYWLIKNAKVNPVFTVVSLEAPHPPYDAPVTVAACATNEITLRANVPRGDGTEAKARAELAGYYAHIEATDRAIGGLLEVTGKDWIVVFTSVHGDMHGAHGLFRKGWPYEESIRVPLLIRKAEKGAGRKDEALVSLWDLPAMTTAWADGTEWGRDTRLAAGKRYAHISMPSVVALPHQCDRMWRGMRSRARKLVLNTDGSPWLFFDLENDPLEKRNLAGDAARSAEIADLRRWV